MRSRVCTPVALLTLLASASDVQAQMVPELMHPAAVDWGSTRVVVMLCVLAVVAPVYLATFILLFRRRKLYPIAGRGIFFVLGLGIVCFVASAFNAAAHIAFPDGQPCGVHALILWLCAPFGVIMLIRSWTLMFNLGIQSFLTELAWRQTKRAKLMERSEAEATTSAGAGGGGSMLGSRVSAGAQLPSPSAAGAAAAGGGKLARGGSTVIRVEPVAVATLTGPLSMPSLDPKSIPGYFFVTHRHWTRVGNVLLVLSGFSLLIALMVGLIMAYDPDIAFTDNWRRERGYAPLDMPSQLTPATFFHAPRCFWYSIKTWSFIFASAIANPYVAMIAIRIRTHTIRDTKRAKEQAEFYKALRALDGIAEPAVGGAGSGSGSGSGSGPSRSSSLELDEFSAVKVEVAVGLNCASLGLALYMLMTGLGGYNWINLMNVGMFFTFFMGSSVQPLWISFVTSKRIKTMMEQARADTKGGGGASTGGKSKGGKIVAQIAHHRPLYRLAHIMLDKACYPYLLAFLQKEYSSENSLFWHEARRFARAARTAETEITGWTSHMDEEDGGSVMDTQFHAAATNQSQVVVRAPAAVSSQVRVGSSPIMKPMSSASAAATHPSPVMQAFALPEPAIPMLPSSGSNAIAARHTDSPQGSPVPRDSPQGSPISVGGPILLARQSSASSGGSSALPISPAGSVVMMTPPRSKMLPRAESNAASDPALGSPGGARSSGGNIALVKSASTLSLQLPSKGAVQAPALTFREMHETASHVRLWSLQLYADYLKPAAVYQINIDSDLAKMVTAMVKQLEQWEPSPAPEELDTSPPVPPPFPLSSLYKQTALSVFNLMETDSFRRFLLTADFQALLQRADEQEMERLERQPGVGASLASTLAKADEALKLAVASEDGAVMLPGTPQQSPAASTPAGFSRIKSNMVPQSKLQAHAPRASISEEDGELESESIN